MFEIGSGQGAYLSGARPLLPCFNNHPAITHTHTQAGIKSQKYARPRGGGQGCGVFVGAKEDNFEGVSDFLWMIRGRSLLVHENWSSFRAFSFSPWGLVCLLLLW